MLDICIFLCTQELPFRGHNETEDSFNRGHFKELISLWSKHDNHLRKFLEKDADNKSVFSGTSKTIQNDLIDSINFILNKKIDDEISKASFISWQVDESTDISCKSQLSVIFRYVNDGKVVERFMGFFDVSTGRTSEDLFQLLTHKFGKYNLETKLVAQTYDGAAVMAGELNGLQAKIKSIAPQAIFTHCYAHALNLVMGKACNSIQQVRVFFSTLSGFSAYFSKSTKRTNVLDQICKNRLPTNAPTRWNFTSRAVLTVNTYREKLIEVFDFIIESPDFDQSSIREAVGLRSSLQDFKFIFFLETFQLIFEQTDVIFAMLQNKFTDIIKAKTHLLSLLSKLREFRASDDYFNKIFVKIDVSEPAPKRRRNDELPDKQQQLRHIFFEILDTVINQIEIRFSDLEKLHFFDLLNYSKFPIYAKHFPDDLIQTLVKQYTFFDQVQLKNELLVVYSNEVLGDSKTPTQMLQHIITNSFQNFMPEFYKLLCLSVTLPVTSTSVERSFSTLKRIKNYSRNSIGQSRLSNMAQIAIERELVKSCSTSEQFAEDIVDHFSQQKDRRIQLIYKKL